MDLVFDIVQCGDLHVLTWLQTTVDTTGEAWAASTKRVAEKKREVKGDISKLRVLAVTDGGAPGTMQRRELFTELLEGQVIGVGITTVLNNPIKRGIVTAILWLNPKFNAYNPDRYREAFAHIHVEPHAETLLRALQRMQEGMSPVNTLQQMLKAAGM